MKRIFLFLPVILASCAEDTSDLATLNKQRDSLVAVIAQSESALKEIELSIANLDTTQRLTLVSTVEVQPSVFEHFVEVVGTLEAGGNTALFPETSGNIERILVKEGQRVKAGQVLMEMDGKVLQANIREAQTSLDLATTVYERQAKLWEQKIGSEIQYLQAKNNKEGLESRLQTLQQQLAMTRIKAPFAGVVDEIFPKVGEMASPAQPAFRLINLDKPYVEAEVSEAYATAVKVGSPARIHFPNLDTTLTGTVRQVGDYINPTNRSFKVMIDIPGNHPELKANLLATINIRDLSVANAIVLPNYIIQQSADGSDFVYVAQVDGRSATVARRTIKTGVSYKGNTQILSGLNPGEVVVDRGSRSIKNGQTVEIVND
jgi:RND family efflux transporter MFP subunit